MPQDNCRKDKLYDIAQNHLSLNRQLLLMTASNRNANHFVSITKYLVYLTFYLQPNIYYKYYGFRMI